VILGFYRYESEVDSEVGDKWLGFGWRQGGLLAQLYMGELSLVPGLALDGPLLDSILPCMNLYS
jgi:hypothetical protein